MGGREERRRAKKDRNMRERPEKRREERERINARGGGLGLELDHNKA